jgi:lia operon protein LiaG
MTLLSTFRTGAATSAAAVMLLTSLASAQTAERRTLSGNDIAVYNIAGIMRVEGGTGSDVVVEVTRGGRDASRLQLATGTIRGREALRVVYPNERRIVYRQGDWGRWRSRTSIHVDDDGTFNDGRTDDGRRVDIVGDGDGLDAYADVRVVVPRGKRLSVFLGVGEAKIENVDGELYVDVSAAAVTATRTRGRLSLDTGSGEVRVTDAQGDIELDTGSGNVEATNIRGTRLSMDTGSGRVRASDVVVDDVELDTGSGSVRLMQVQSKRITLDSGSGSVELELRADVESVRIDSGSGGVTLGIPESLGAAIRIDTGSGGIDTDIPIQVRKAERNYLSGSIGDGKGEIVIETGSGGVRLRRS